MNKVKRFKKEELLDFVVRYLKELSVPEVDAGIVGEVLISADMRGIDSHGLHRLGSYYGSRIMKKFLNPETPYRIVNETPTTALIDGGNGCGQVVSYRAMQLCIEKAGRVGLSAITVNNSNHFGIAGYYSMMALEHNMIGICLTNSQPLVAPTYGRSPVLGTNPISIAVPTGEKHPFVLDMATSAVAFGKVQIYAKKNEPIPDGWAIDSDGRPTNDPQQIKTGGIGALLPLGGHDITSGYKGYNLAVMVDILCSILSGGNYLSQVGGPSSPLPTGVSHFFMALSIEAFRPIADFKNQIDGMIDLLQHSPLASGQEKILIAGEKEFELEEYNRIHGVPLIQQIVDDLEKEGEKVGVKFPSCINENNF